MGLRRRVESKRGEPRRYASAGRCAGSPRCRETPLRGAARHPAPHRLTATESARPDALGPAAAIVDAFAATGLLEFAYLAPAEDDDEDGPSRGIEASEAIVDKERDAVVVAGARSLEVFDGPITLEDPPEHEADS